MKSDLFLPKNDVDIPKIDVYMNPDISINTYFELSGVHFGNLCCNFHPWREEKSLEPGREGVIFIRLMCAFIPDLFTGVALIS